MRYRKLGRTDLNVSEISLGCSGFWGNKKFSGKNASAIVMEAFERGVNFFDTGHNYSKFYAEPRLGGIVKEILSKNDRSRLVISTKGGNAIGAWQPSFLLKSGAEKLPQNFSPDAIELSCSESIKNLNCDYLDIFQLLMDESEINEQLVQRLSQMKQKGMFRYLGINTHLESDMLFISKHPEIFDMVLIDYNVLQLDREPVIDKLYQAGIGVVAGTVLAQGHLLRGKIGSLKTGSYFWYLARTMLKSTSRRLASSSKEMRDVLASIAGMTASQAAFSYILGNKAVASCVFGTTNITHLIDVIAATDKKLAKSDIVSIRKAYQAMPCKISE